MMERRRCQRIAPPQRLRASVKTAEAALVVDLSPHGALLEVATPLAPSRECNVALSLVAGELRLRGVVHRCRASTGMLGEGMVFHAGLEFVRLGAQQQQLLQDALVDLCLTELADACGPRSSAGSPEAHLQPSSCYKERP